MVDAAGAIYVIGGRYGDGGQGTTVFNDVWASTDGGARPDSFRVVGWYSRGYAGVLHGYDRSTSEYYRYSRVIMGYLWY